MLLFAVHNGRLTVLSTPSFSGDTLSMALFVYAIFYGDVYLGVTVPAAVLVLPVVILFRGLIKPRRLVLPPVGLFFLSATGVSVLLQTVVGYGPRGKTDLVAYLPLVYAAVTLIVLSGSGISDRHLHASFVGAGLLAGAILVVTLLFAHAGFYPVPGQNPEVARQREEAARAVVPAKPAADPPHEPRVLHETRARQIYYEFKNRARTPLGMSNYLAVMFVFLLNVMLYQRSRWAIAFAAMVLATLSRAGIAFVVISVFGWAAYTHGKLRPALLAAGVVVCAAWLGALLFREELRAIAGMETVTARIWFQTNAVTPILSHPVIGVPRSELLFRFGYPLWWNPHNSILHLMVLFGAVGTLGYLGYVAAALKAIVRRATFSRLWAGVAAGFVVALLWSLVEIVVLTPAFEVLLAALYAGAKTPATNVDRPA